MKAFINIIGNMTCDFINSNKGISHDEVINFIKASIIELKHYADLPKNKINFPDPPEAELTIRML